MLSFFPPILMACLSNEVGGCVQRTLTLTVELSGVSRRGGGNRSSPVRGARGVGAATRYPTQCRPRGDRPGASWLRQGACAKYQRTKNLSQAASLKKGSASRYAVARILSISLRRSDQGKTIVSLKLRHKARTTTAQSFYSLSRRYAVARVL